MNEMYESAIKELKRKTMLLGCWLCSCHHHIDNNRYKRFHLLENEQFKHIFENHRIMSET